MKIITLTLSPAIDLTYSVGGEISLGLMRASTFSTSAGGKGINVCRAIVCESKKCGVDTDVRALYPCGGDTGELLHTMLSREGVPSCAITTESPCRVNVSAIDEAGRDIEINAKGTRLSQNEKKKIEDELSVLGDGDVLAICGSLPQGVAASYYTELIGKIKSRGVTCILDCDGEALRLAMCGECTEFYPDYIKPNEFELEALCASLGIPNSPEDVAEYTGGRTAVLATYGGSGAALVRYACGEARKTVVKSTPVKPVRLKGAGDTLLGAFMYHKFVLSDDDVTSLSAAVKTAGDYVGGAL